MAQLSEFSGSPTAAHGAFGQRILALADHLASWSETADALTCTYLSTAHLAVAEELAKLMKKAGLTVALDPSLWLSVFGKAGHSSAEVTAAFQAAAADVQNVGVTFGGCYAGHGVYVVDGPAWFIMTGYAL